MNRKNKVQRARRDQLSHEQSQLTELRQMADQVKPLLVQSGCHLPFYDFLDSYQVEFKKIADEAQRQFPSLLGIHEVSNQDYGNIHWPSLGYSELRQIFFLVDDKYEEYSGHAPDANITGATSFFVDGQGTIRSIVTLPRNPPNSFEAPDLKYALKVAALLHELGHVHDAESRGNIDPAFKRFEILEAEVFANCYALDQLADRCLRQSYEMYFHAWKKLADEEPSFVGEIGREVMKQHARRQIPNWQIEFGQAADELAARLQSV